VVSRNGRRRSLRNELRVLALAGLLWAAPAAALTPAEVAARLAADYGVEVLEVKEVQRDGERLFAVTVMLPRDAGNAAFQVGTLLLDAETGRPVPRLFHRPDGWSAAPPPVSVPEPAGPVLRRESLARDRIR
jgi:hypothetical protein